MNRTGRLTRTQIIQYLIDKYKYKSYLEIGVQNGVNFKLINCDKKIGVDPDETSKATHYLTSDAFFLHNKEKFDIIFIDGLHYAEQVEKDIDNSLNVLSENGIIVCHDMIPSSFVSQLVPRVSKHWNGNCWKAFIKFRTRNDLQMHTVKTDCGLGIIKKGSQYPLSVDAAPDTYQDLLKDQEHFMNAINEEEFFKLY